MKNINIGVANLIITNKLKNAYFNKDLINESRNLTQNFIDVIKSSPILKLEYKVYNNIENKHIDNELLATRYIDNNIKLFETYTLKEIENERNKISKFIIGEAHKINEYKENLYNAINTLIVESLKDYDDINVDAIHESFQIVLNHIKSPKTENKENIDFQNINEDIIEIAINKFNKKYEMLSENDKKLLQTLLSPNKEEKLNLFEVYKTETLKILNELDNNMVKDNIQKAIKKINEMNINENIEDDIINLYELKKNLS